MENKKITTSNQNDWMLKAEELYTKITGRKYHLGNKQGGFVIASKKGVNKSKKEEKDENICGDDGRP